MAPKMVKAKVVDGRALDVEECNPMVNKWFKNPRYLALKARKYRGLSPTMSQDISTASRAAILSCEEDSHETLNGFFKNKRTKLILPLARRKQNDASLVLSPAVDRFLRRIDGGV